MYVPVTLAINFIVIKTLNPKPYRLYTHCQAGTTIQGCSGVVGYRLWGLGVEGFACNSEEDAVRWWGQALGVGV